jgi:hypothetical protein
MDHDAPASHASSHTALSRLALIELVERDGRVSRVMDVHGWPISMGRAISNDFVIDDPHVAARHATLDLDEQGTLRLRVGDTVNGLQLNDVALGAGQSAAVPEGGAALQLGALRLRIRLPAEVLAPEKPLPLHRLASWAAVGAAAALLAVLSVGERWVGLDPGADLSAWMPLLLGLPATIACWAGVWALASKLFQHRFDFAGHLRIMIPWLLGVAVADALVEPLGAALGWPWLWRLSPLVEAFLAVMMLRAQLLHVLPHSRRAVTGAAAAAALAGLGLSMTLTHRQTDRVSRPPYMSSLPLPGLVLSAPQPANGLVQDLASLAEQLAQRVEKAKAEEAADGSEGSAD